MPIINPALSSLATGGSSDGNNASSSSTVFAPAASPPRFSASKMSSVSNSLDEVNVPEVSEQKASFVYNFYTRDERVTLPTTKSSRGTSLPMDKIPRYVSLSWKSPKISDYQVTLQNYISQVPTSISASANKIVSEDNYFNPGYLTHTFSNVDQIEQGSTDLENFNRMCRYESEGLFNMAKFQIRQISLQGTNNSSTYGDFLNELYSQYTNLINFPKSSLGLRVIDDRNREVVDKDDLISTVANSLKLNMKINKAVIPDIFNSSREKGVPSSLSALKTFYSESVQGNFTNNRNSVLYPISSGAPIKSYQSQPVKLIGYIVDRYRVTTSGFRKEETFYIEDISKTNLDDPGVLYGYAYVYTVRVVASIQMLAYNSDNTKVNSSIIYVSSRPVSVPVECFEYAPPPPPTNLRFTYDYKKKNVVVMWDLPINSQADIKQIQVMRRKTIKEPFELIAQYHFDRTEVGSNGLESYKTYERVDGNNLKNLRLEDRYLVIQQPEGVDPETPATHHVDKDFVVDTEFYESSKYIYSVCSIDAHGMISNYSSQHEVTFDPYKNKLVTKLICESGSPRQYPNFYLKADAFKDVIRVQGNNARKMTVYFSPELLRIKDDRNAESLVVSTKNSTNRDPYYLLQLINLDNQKLQLLKINITDNDDNLSLMNRSGVTGMSMINSAIANTSRFFR